MKRLHSIFISTVLILCVASSFGQRPQRFIIGVQADLIKSDNDGFFEKVQGGVEGNFYISRKFSASVGTEVWTGDEIIAVAGARFSPIDEGFFRIRGLIGKDFSIGAGFAKPLSENVRIEAMTDLYFNGHIAIRAGIACGIGRRP
jgi:hypothetical protein